MTLTVSGRYLFEDGKPFFWLGDTAWLLFEKLTRKETEFYISDRAEKEFNVIQTTIFHTGEGMKSGRTACAEYFDKIASAVEYAQKRGVYMALLPCWGSFVKSGIINGGNVKSYADFLGKRFAEYENVVWVLGGDVRGSVDPSLYNSFAETLKKHNPRRPITFHPFGRTGSYKWFNGCGWLDFNMFQSGHRRYGQTFAQAFDNGQPGETDYEEDNYKYVEEALALSPLKPVLDGEPSYEGIVQGLHDFTQPYWTARDVRRYAYWSVLAGACGFTYGHNAVMQFHSFGDADANYGVREEWRTALAAEGAAQMKYLKRLMLAVDFTNGSPRGDLVADNGERYEHTACFAGENYALAYRSDGGEIRLKNPFGGRFEAFAYNPADGKTEPVEPVENANLLIFPRRGKNDRVIVLKKL